MAAACLVMETLQGCADPLMPAPDLPPEQLALLWALLMEEPEAIAQLMRGPRRLRLPRRAGVVAMQAARMNQAFIL